MTFKGPFQSTLFYDSIISCITHLSYSNSSSPHVLSPLTSLCLPDSCSITQLPNTLQLLGSWPRTWCESLQETELDNADLWKHENYTKVGTDGHKINFSLKTHHPEQLVFLKMPHGVDIRNVPNFLQLSILILHSTKAITAFNYSSPEKKKISPNENTGYTERKKESDNTKDFGQSSIFNSKFFKGKKKKSMDVKA